ncbi:MAG: pantoate--beta-alanine ligase [Bacteroidia bacterium]|nr:pantoate--beta-alanine ligase [Bacteroidia bacterium]
MQIFRTIPEFRNFRKNLPREMKVGFVPTMGALHEGHASLVSSSAKENDITISSVFVNPTQFGPKEDLSKYPRMLEKDAEILEKNGATVLFAPSTAEIYPESPSQIGFTIQSLGDKLCGASRPGHFNGVVQVVSLLFHIVRPDNAYFGEKDFQQLMIIRQLVAEQHFEVNIHGCPIVRESDGLAMSSRNLYLSAEERSQAVVLSQILFYLKEHYHQFKDADAVKSFVSEQISKKSVMRLDYFEILSEKGLKDIAVWENTEKPHAFIAAFCGNTRLIDNIPLFS